MTVVDNTVLDTVGSSEMCASSDIARLRNPYAP